MQVVQTHNFDCIISREFILSTYGKIKPLSADFTQASKQLRKEALMSVYDLMQSERYKEFFDVVEQMSLNIIYDFKDLAIRLGDTSAQRLVEYRIESLMTPWSNSDKSDLLYWAEKKHYNWMEVAWFLKRTPFDCKQVHNQLTYRDPAEMGAELRAICHEL